MAILFEGRLGNELKFWQVVIDEKATKRLQDIRKVLDKRTCGYKRRLEAIAKSTDQLEDMVKRALTLGIKADYILMDSWFCWPSNNGAMMIKRP